MKRSHPTGRGLFCAHMDQLLTYALLGVLLIREGMHFVERRDMLDRLMARSLPEYKDNTQPEDNQLEDESDDDSVPIEQAEQDLLGGDDGEEK